MGNILDTIKEEASSLLQDKKKLISLLVLGIVILGLPIGLNLIKEQKIFQPKADTDNIKFVDSSDNPLPENNNGTPYTYSTSVRLQILSPYAAGSSEIPEDPDPNPTSIRSENPLLSFFSKGLVKTVYAENNYCLAGGYHECSVGTPVGSCTKDGKTCTKYETYQCNFGGKNYCDTSNCTDPCTGGGSGNTGQGCNDNQYRNAAGNCVDKITPESDAGGCCDPGAGNNTPRGCRRDSNPGGFREVCDGDNGACSTGKACRSETGCALDTDCGFGKHCESGQCKGGAANNNCKVTGSIQARFNSSASLTVASGTKVTAGVYRNNTGVAMAAPVNGVNPSNDTFSASVSGPNGFSLNVNTAGSTDFTPTVAGTYTLRGTCGVNLSASATLTVTGAPPSTSTPTCTVTASSSSVNTGSDVSFTYSGNANKSGTSDVSLFVEKADGTPLAATVGQLVANRGKNYYKLDICKSTNSSSCNGSKSVSTSSTGDITHLPPGNYIAHCNAETRDTATQCSGNPFCNFNGATSSTPGGTIDCNGWHSCSGTLNQRGGDVVAFTVGAGTVTPTPTPTPTPSSSASPVYTTHFKVSDSQSGINTANWIPYTQTPILYTLNLSTNNINPGTKTVFVKFKYSNNQEEQKSAQFILYGSDPTITGCSLSSSGNTTTLNITGSNFGSTRGVLKSGENPLTISQWKTDSIKATWSSAPSGEAIPITVTNTDGQVSEEGQCGSLAGLSLGAKVFCRAPSQHQASNVDLVIAGAFVNGPLIKQKVTIGADGIISGLDQRLQSGKEYKLSLKAPKTLRTTKTFTAGDGLTNITDFILPTGDIFPADGGDGVINSLDRAELNRQWNITSSAEGRSGDFNQDGRVNSIDWACMRYDFGKSDAAIPAPGGPPVSNPDPTSSTTNPSSSPTASPSSRPTASPSSRPTASPSSRPTASPTAIPSSRPTANPTSAPVTVILSQGFIIDHGLSSSYRNCDITDSGGIGGVNLSTCNASWRNGLLTGAGLPSGANFKSIHSFVYTANGQTKLSQGLIASDGKTTYYRDCLINSGVVDYAGCQNTWRTGTLTGAGLPDEIYNGVYSFTNVENGQNVLRQVIIRNDKLSFYYRQCNINPTGIDYAGCQNSWRIGTFVGSGLPAGAKFKGASAWTYVQNGQKKLHQSFLTDDGLSTYYRECNIDSEGNIDLTATWRTGPLTGAGLPQGQKFLDFHSFEIPK